MYLAPVLSRGHAIGFLVLEYEVPSQTACCAYLAGKQIRLLENGSAAGQAGGKQRFCVCLCLAGPSLPRCLQQLSFCGSLHCVIVSEVTDTLRQRERSVQACSSRGSVSAGIMEGTDTPRCLQIPSILCVVF
jgi:hypothetical protein